MKKRIEDQPAKAEPQTLADLKAGDEVAVIESWGQSAISVVARITPTGRIVVGSISYDSKGYMVGRKRGYPSSKLAIPNDSHRQVAAIRKACNIWDRIQKSAKSLTLDQANRLAAFLDAFAAEIKGEDR